jgi:hypothetical protein
LRDKHYDKTWAASIWGAARATSPLALDAVQAAFYARSNQMIGSSPVAL